MTATRREFLKISGGVLAAGAYGHSTFAAAGDPALGLIFPPLNYPIPPDANRLYPRGVEFIGNGLGLPGGMTIEGYDEAVPRILPAAQELAKRGAKFHADLIAQVANATGVPATTQSAGLLDGLRVANAKRVALATAYTDTVTARLKVFLEEYGFTVTAAKGLGLTQVPDDANTREVLLKLGRDAYAESSRADALVMSCGALRTLDVIVPLEGAINVPVISSTPHGLMNGVRLLGVAPRVQGFGMVFAKA